MPALPGGVPVAGRLSLSAMRQPGRLRAGGARALPVLIVPAPGIGNGGHGAAPDAGPSPALVRGHLSGHNPYAGVLGDPAPAAARPRPVRDGVDDAAEAAPRDAAPGYPRSRRIALLERSWGAGYPPRYAALLRPSSPSFRHSPCHNRRCRTGQEVRQRQDLRAASWAGATPDAVTSPAEAAG